MSQVVVLTGLSITHPNNILHSSQFVKTPLIKAYALEDAIIVCLLVEMHDALDNADSFSWVSDASHLNFQHISSYPLQNRVERGSFYGCRSVAAIDAFIPVSDTKLENGKNVASHDSTINQWLIFC